MTSDPLTWAATDIIVCIVASDNRNQLNKYEEEPPRWETPDWEYIFLPHHYYQTHSIISISKSGNVFFSFWPETVGKVLISYIEKVQLYFMSQIKIPTVSHFSNWPKQCGGTRGFFEVQHNMATAAGLEGDIYSEPRTKLFMTLFPIKNPSQLLSGHGRNLVQTQCGDQLRYSTEARLGEQL